MTPYKNFLESAKTYLSSTPFLQFLLMAGMYIFALGALLYIIDLFVYTYMILSGLGRVLMFAGLLLTLIKQEDLALVIISGVVALACLAGWIVSLVGTSYMGYRISVFVFEPLLYFLGFGAIALFTGLKSEKFKQMRAEAAARAQYQQQQYAQQQQQYMQQQQQYMQQQAQQQAQAAPPPAAPAAAPAPAAAGKKCTKCGADLPADAVFCGSCGTKQ